MFGVLLLKEIRESMVTIRFVLVTLICLVLIPLGMFVSRREYELRVANYREAIRIYTERSAGSIGSSFVAEGYRPPSLLGVFSSGIKHLLPYRVTTSRDGFIVESQPVDKNPQSELFGDIDFVFNVGIVLSILALTFTFNAITGEREQGTIRLMLSGSVSRGTILAAKLFGNFMVFLVPFALSIMVCLIILGLSGYFPFTAFDTALPLLVIVAVSVLFLLSMFSLGMLVSTLTHSSITSMITLLFVWVVLILAIPTVSPLIAQVIHPIESENVIDTRIAMIRESLGKELNTKKHELYARILTQRGIDTKNLTFSTFGSVLIPEAMKEYDEEVVPLQEDYDRRIADEIAKIENGYSHDRQKQEGIATFLSRLSPKSCYTYLVAEFAGTGTSERDTFQSYAARFYDSVKRDIYDNYSEINYGVPNGMAYSGMKKADGFDEKNVPVPQLTGYRSASFETRFAAEWMDFLLLTLYTVLFFTLAFVGFLRYDVR